MSAMLAPGARVEIRDAEWRIKRIDLASDGGQLLTCEGLSELVRGRESTFLTKLENSVRVLEPEATTLVDDISSGYRASLLYLDTLIRKTPPSDDKIHVGHQAAMDQLPYQLDPALQALAQPRQRILIADSVGLVSVHSETSFPRGIGDPIVSPFIFRSHNHVYQISAPLARAVAANR